MSPLNSPNNPYICRIVSKFGRILFTSIQLTAVACCASWPLKVRLSFLSQNVPPPPPKPLYKYRYIYTCRHLVTGHFPSWLIRFFHSLLWLSLTLQFNVGWNINTGLWSDNSFLTRKVAYCTPRNSDKSNAQKWYPQISMFTATGGSTDLPLVVLW